MIQLHGLHIALNFLGFWSLFAFCGLLLAKTWLLPSAAFAIPDLNSRWRQMLGECLALMTFSGVMLLLVRTAEMDEGTLGSVLSDLPLVLAQTHFGRVWSLHLLTLALLWAGFAVQHVLPPRIWAVCMVTGMLALSFTYSASSHASDNGDFTLAELNDWAHVVSTAVWGGGIFATVLLIFPLLRERHALLAVMARKLSASSGAALAFVLITGIYNALRQLPGWDGLLTTTYGRVLAVKMAVTGALMLVGAWNRFALVPRLMASASGDALAAAAPSRQLFRMLVADAVLVLLAIVMAAILAQTEAR